MPGIALDARYIYIASPSQLSVTRANLDGSSIEITEKTSGG